MEEDKKCSKCGSKMLSDKKLGSGAVETSLFTKSEFRGDDIKPYYCRKCGFMELYRNENKPLPVVTSERELLEYSDTQE